MKAVLLAAVLVVACSSKKTEPTGGSGSDTTAASGSDTAAGSDRGSDTAAGSGSNAAGSGSDTTAGSGSDNSGSDMAGSGSDVAKGSDDGDDHEDDEHKSAFDKMSGEEKRDFMKKKVVPPMRTAFQKFDAKKFKKFGCKTCHGKDPKGKKYKMPNDELPKLDWAALKKGKDKKIHEFMEKFVRPEMAKILGEPEYSKDNPDGFSCLGCHLEKK